MERSEIRGHRTSNNFPDCAALHPGYDAMIGVAPKFSYACAASGTLIEVLA
jgi:hypothetical protein